MIGQRSRGSSSRRVDRVAGDTVSRSRKSPPDPPRPGSRDRPPRPATGAARRRYQSRSGRRCDARAANPPWAIKRAALGTARLTIGLRATAARRERRARCRAWRLQSSEGLAFACVSLTCARTPKLVVARDSARGILARDGAIPTACDRECGTNLTRTTVEKLTHCGTQTSFGSARSRPGTRLPGAAPPFGTRRPSDHELSARALLVASARCWPPPASRF